LGAFIVVVRRGSAITGRLSANTVRNALLRGEHVQKWEIGENKPSGPSLKLLNVIDKKGVDALV
jgi:DNA-binding transcriptional regulator YiaG